MPNKTSAGAQRPIRSHWMLRPSPQSYKNSKQPTKQAPQGKHNHSKQQSRRYNEQTQTVKGGKGEGSSSASPSPPACAPPLSGASTSSPPPQTPNEPMRRYPDFGIRVLMSARVAATAQRNPPLQVPAEGGPGRRGGDKRHIGGIFLRNGRRVVCPARTPPGSTPEPCLCWGPPQPPTPNRCPST